MRYGDVCVLITKCTMFERSLCNQFFKHMPIMREILKEGHPYWNGEDILMSAVARFHYGVNNLGVKKCGNINPIEGRENKRNRAIASWKGHREYRGKVVWHCAVTLIYGTNGQEKAMNNPFDFFDEIYCINLERRTDRWNQCQSEFDKIGIADRVIKFDAFDNKENPKKGCYDSHLSVIKLAYERKLKNVLIFEDDVAFLKNMMIKY